MMERRRPPTEAVPIASEPVADVQPERPKSPAVRWVTAAIALVFLLLALGAVVAFRPQRSGPGEVPDLRAAPPFVVNLDVQPQPAAVVVKGRVTNVGLRPADPNLYASVLVVDGVPWPSWPLVIGNGTIEESSLALAPGQAAQFERDLAPDAFKPGVHVLVLSTGGVSSAPITIRMG